jgi:hypothetical protein
MANKPKRKPAGTIPQRKKSISKASASKGREDSRAVQVKRRKHEKTLKSKQDRAAVADVYADREHDVDRQRKVRRSVKRKQKSR